jgi:hypothetical protein
MFARVKTSRGEEYLQIVENYRDAGRVQQRLVLYVGHYESIDDALQRMPKELCYLRGRFRRGSMLEEAGRRLIGAAEERLQALQALVQEHPDLLARDRERAARYARRQAERADKQRLDGGSA